MAYDVVLRRLPANEKIAIRRKLIRAAASRPQMFNPVCLNQKPVRSRPFDQGTHEPPRRTPTCQLVLWSRTREERTAREAAASVVAFRRARWLQIALRQNHSYDRFRTTSAFNVATMDLHERRRRHSIRPLNALAARGDDVRPAQGLLRLEGRNERVRLARAHPETVGAPRERPAEKDLAKAAPARLRKAADCASLPLPEEASSKENGHRSGRRL